MRGIEIMLRELAVQDPKAKAARPEEFVNLAFIRELDSSGFIDRLYKAQPVVATREERAAPVAQIAKENPVPASGKKTTAEAVTKSEGAATSAADVAMEYTVEAGDTLSGLARKYYGDGLKWEKMFAANKQTMKNLNYIYIGQRIVIPS
jgi:nucleoid-associated protein YgaU